MAIKRTAGRLVSRNVGPLVANGALCTQQQNVLWHSGCVLAGWVCVLRGVSSKLYRMLYSMAISFHVSYVLQSGCCGAASYCVCIC